MDWQPIENAPKNGLAIWLLVEGRPYIGFCRNGDWLEQEDKWWVAGGFRRRTEAERKERGLADEVFSTYSQAEPTHWMPLPEPPK